ncbi:MAG TPA: GNAT family N-acetyltransferase [Acidimicrobiales bacterium]|nr:GNAT family N-acetyltransferase [Acidimicrobiales bacterium]
MRLRPATVADIEGIAELHADSWRRNYRGAFGDAFLDGDLVGERRAAWTERLTQPGPNDHTIVADPGDGDSTVVGLAHTIFDRDPQLGAVLDNLHVRHGLKGQGLGRRLVVATAEAVVAHDPESGLYVEVLEQNTAAHAFYERLGARCVHQGTFAPPGGGLTHERRYAWPTPATLLQ